MIVKFIIPFLLFVANAYSQNKSSHSITNYIKEEAFVRINGIDQWVTIKGDRSKPVVLFLHGGPGSPLSPYADAIYEEWEKDFILVQWDQRGTGKTFGRNRPEELTPEYVQSNPLTIEQMTSDGIELVKYLIRRLEKQKIILFGTSWGTIPGVKMALKNPELFYAYIGHSQMVNPSAATVYAWQKVYQLAQTASDETSLQVLNSIGKPPYDTARHLGQLMRIIKKYQQKNAVPAPADWFKISPQYDNEKDARDRSDGDDYSFLNYAGDKRFGISSMVSTVDFLKDGFVFNIPVYLIQGQEDIQTPELITREYFSKIKAAGKEYILLPKTDHGFNESVLKAQYKVMALALKPSINGQTGANSLEQKVDAILNDYKGNDKPGATIGIIDNGVLVFKKGYGMANLEKRIPNGPAISYKIASVSKQFTAASIANLVQLNKISLDDNIRKYIPELPDYGKPITIANLLYHTSGIRDYMVLMWLTGIDFEDKFSNKDALEIILRQQSLNFITGNRCVYSNSNYILLAEVVRKVTGASLKEFAHKNIFSQLKMNNSGFDGYKISNKTKVALSYRKSGSGYTSFRNENETFGDGGIVSTVEDLVNWDQTFYDPNTTAAQIVRVGKLDNGNILSYGMGIMTGQYRREPVQMHPGAFLGYRAEMLRFPRKKITIICLGNSEEINPETITRAIADVYVFNDAGIEKNEKEQISNGDIEPNHSITGKYEINPNVFIDIRYENNRLTGQATGQPRQFLYPDGENIYQIGATGDKVIFSEVLPDGSRQLEIVQKQGKTIAKKLDVVAGEAVNEYLGRYYNAEQKATYVFYAENGSLWFKVGKNAPQQAAIYKKYDRLTFSYLNLESATIQFNRDSAGKIEGFTLSSGRVAGLKFNTIL